eukprot:g22706.t1
MELEKHSSLNLAIGKNLEFIIKDGIVEYLEMHDKIGLSQHGFIKGMLCLANLLAFFEVVTSKFDKGEPVDVIHLVFQKTFDKVSHRRLLNKIGAHGVKGKDEDVLARQHLLPRGQLRIIHIIVGLESHVGQT